MDDKTIAKAKAAGTIALGAGRVASGILMATGHGLIGSFLRKHHMMRHAMRMGSESVKGGLKMVDDGLDEWKKHT
ncbi:MAG: hypothetical protein KGL54_03960 [Sphingomonadales bacterium]|nr:hypothetical protein [Sphingomonadales bacterium]